MSILSEVKECLANFEVLFTNVEVTPDNEVIVYGVIIDDGHEVDVIVTGENIATAGVSWSSHH